MWLPSRWKFHSRCAFRPRLRNNYEANDRNDWTRFHVRASSRECSKTNGPVIVLPWTHVVKPNGCYAAVGVGFVSAPCKFGLGTCEFQTCSAQCAARLGSPFHKKNMEIRSQRFGAKLSQHQCDLAPMVS